MARGAERGVTAPGQRAPRGTAAGAREAPCPRAAREASRSRLVRRARPVREASRGRVRHARQAPVGRRGGDGLRNDPRPQGLRLLTGLHGVRRIALRGVRREGVQGHGPGRQIRVPRRRDQRLRWSADPGGSGFARRVRGDLLAQRAVLRGRPADLARHGAVCRGCGLLACDHGLRAHGRGDGLHVHHGPRRREDRHGRGRDVRGARGRVGPRDEVGCCALHRPRRGDVHRGRAVPALVPAAEQPRAAAVRTAGRSGRT